jgi:putative ABC transport system permease protein
MPPATSSSNRAMFWRIIRRFIAGNPGRLAVMLLALSASAAITAALLNLKVDAQRRLTTEFRAFGANVIVAPRNTSATAGSQNTLDESVLRLIPDDWDELPVDIVPFLYLVADARNTSADHQMPVVIAGKDAGVTWLSGSVPLWKTLISCKIGSRVAARMQLKPSDQLVLQTQAHQQPCNRASVSSNTGGPQDDQITVPLGAAQQLAALPGRISVIELTVPGTPEQISMYIGVLRQRLPDADVRPRRQFTEGEARIYNRISGVLIATVAVVLILTALCVMAAMTNVAMERRNDVGLMKAIGGATRRVLRLFLVEAALLGLASGILGATIGITLSMWLGKAVFGLAARPRLIVYPVAVVLTVIVAIAGAYPLRRLANIRPASVFRGEA